MGQTERTCARPVAWLRCTRERDHDGTCAVWTTTRASILWARLRRREPRLSWWTADDIYDGAH